jgi:UPF0755 protein
MELVSYLRGASLAVMAHLLRRVRAYAVGSVLLLALLVSLPLLIPALSFKEGTYVRIEEGMSVDRIADALESSGAIGNTLLFKAVLRLTGADDSLNQGTYLFTRPLNMFEIAHRLSHGITGIAPLRITVPEGYASYQMADLFAERLPRFDRGVFEVEAALEEGYLFPDTYDFFEDATEEDVRQRMRENFMEKKRELAGFINDSARSFDEVVIMASILEREAATEEDRRMISGILWKRLDEGMRLQVDAAFAYGQKRETFHPSFADLESDSPYNTYKYGGLPPTAIGNPGLGALEAALAPTESDFLYYLTGKDGVTRYARTFEEHKENRALYLD